MQTFYSHREAYAISTFLFEDWDLETALQSICAHGFHSVELWADKLAHVDPRINPDERKIRHLLETYRMHVHALHTPFRRFRPYADEKDGRAYRLAVWKQAIDFCQRFSIPIAVIHACNRSEYNMCTKDIPYLHGMLSELSEYALERGVKLALENIPSSSPKLQDELFCTLENQYAWFGDIESLFFCLDIGHVTITSNDMESEILAVPADRLVTFHIHNNDGTCDGHKLPDDGIIDWPKWHDLIRSRGFQGQFVLEICGYENPWKRMDAIGALFGKGDAK